jgi:hypothetical protein
MADRTVIFGPGWETLEQAAREGCNFFGAFAVDNVRTKISIPVGRDSSGNVIERSKPGEPPRLETGNLHDSIGHQVFDDADQNQIGVTVYAGTYYAPELEVDYNRPILVDVPDELGNEFFEQLATEIKNKLG